MGMWNRWTNQAEPADWQESHQTGQKDTRSWKIAVHPFYSALLLVRRSLVTAVAAGDHFSLSVAERAQAAEIVARVAAGASAEERVMRMVLLHSILNMVERGLLADQATVYGWLGITTADDR